VSITTKFVVIATKCYIIIAVDEKIGKIGVWTIGENNPGFLNKRPGEDYEKSNNTRIREHEREHDFRTIGPLYDGGCFLE